MIEQTSYLLYGLFIIDLISLRSILKPTSGQQITLKKHFTSMSCTLEPAIQSGDIDICQLTITYMSIRMSTIKLNRDCICLRHLASNARSLQENNAWSLQENSQSECAYYCSHGYDRLSYRAYSHDTTVAILVFQNNETAAILVFQTNPVGVGLFSYVKNFFCSHKIA